MSKPHKSIPGPKEFPFVGAIGALSTDWLATLQALANNYGDIVRFHFVGRQMLLLADPEYIRELLIEKVDLFPKAKFDLDILGKFLGKGLVTNNEPDHRKQRKLVQPAFHSRRVDSYAGTMVQYAGEVSSGWREGEVRDLSEDMMELTLFIVAKTLFDAGRSELANVVDEVSEAVGNLQEISNHDFNSMLRVPDWLPTRRNRLRKASTAALDQTITEIVARRRGFADADGNLPDKGDLLSMLLLARDEQGQPLSDRQLRDELVTLFVAGHETTSNALTWTWYLLAKHPHVRAKLQAELGQVLGVRPPVLADLAQLPYTLQVIKEAMRLHPPVWLLSTREAPADTTIGDYAIPKGTQIFISPYVMHRLPRYFAQPEQFLPERWLAEFEAALPRFAYMPFGGGPRICIGNAFAMMEAQLILATLGQRFDFDLVSDAPIEKDAFITLSPKGGLPMKVHVRRATIAPASPEIPNTRQSETAVVAA